MEHLQVREEVDSGSAIAAKILSRKFICFLLFYVRQLKQQEKIKHFSCLSQYISNLPPVFQNFKISTYISLFLAEPLLGNNEVENGYHVLSDIPYNVICLNLEHFTLSLNPQTKEKTAHKPRFIHKITIFHTVIVVLQYLQQLFCSPSTF